MLLVSMILATILTEKLVSQVYVRSVHARFSTDISREDLNPLIFPPSSTISIFYCFCSILQNGGVILIGNYKEIRKLVCNRGKNLKQVLRG